MAAIVKQFGGVVVSGSDLVAHPKIKIPFSPAFDFAHNGGLQEGTFVVLVGPPRCGKTTSALHFIGNAQQPQWGSRDGVYLNAEARLEPRDVRGIPLLQLDGSRFLIVQSIAAQPDGPGRILTAKDFLTAAEQFLMNTTRKVIVLDSISAMMGESEWNDGLDSVAIGEAQRLFSKFMRRMSQVIAVNNHIFIGIVHLYSNVGGGAMKGPKWLEKMSNSAQYGLASKFRATHMHDWTAGPEKAIIGQIGHWECERSPLGQPGIKFDSYLRYGSGVDEVRELMQYGLDLNFIVKPDKSSFYRMEFVEGSKKPNIQGEDGARTYLVEHPDELATLRNLIYEGLGL